VSEAHQRTLGIILGGAPGFIALKNKQLAYEVVNPRFCQFLGKGVEAIVGKSDGDLFAAAEAEVAAKEERSVLQSGIPRRVEQAFTGATGTGWFEVTRSPILDDSGDPAGVLLVAHDITELRKRSDAAAQFESQKEALEARIGAAESAAATAQEAAAQAEAALQAAQAEASKQAAGLAEATQALEQVQAALAEKNASIESLVQARAAAENQCAELEDALKALEARQNAALAQAAQLLQTLQGGGG